MTRKHFEAIAGALRYNYPKATEWTTEEGFTAAADQWWSDCEAVAEACKAANSNFKMYKFLEACEPKGGR